MHEELLGKKDYPLIDLAGVGDRVLAVVTHEKVGHVGSLTGGFMRIMQLRNQRKCRRNNLILSGHCKVWRKLLLNTFNSRKQDISVSLARLTVWKKLQGLHSYLAGGVAESAAQKKVSSSSTSGNSLCILDFMPKKLLFLWNIIMVLVYALT